MPMSLASTAPAPAPPRDTVSSSRRREPPIRSQRRRKRLVVLLLVIGASGGLVGWLATRARDTSPRDDLETEIVHYGDLPRQIETRGELEPSQSTDLFCRVKALAGNSFSSTIKWVAEPGASVRRGDLVVQLDDSQFQEDLAQRRVPLEQARADWLLAIENLKIVASQNAGDIASAEAAVQLAELDLKKCVEADQHAARVDLRGRVKLAEANLESAREHLAYTERMKRRGFASDAQVRAERNRTATMELGLDSLHDQVGRMDAYDQPLELATLRGKLAEARRAAHLAKEHAVSKEIQANTDRLSKQRIYQRRLTRYHEIEAEAVKCRIVAPHDGMVIYSMSEQTRSGWGGYQALVAPGEQVREGQKLIRIAQLRRMLVHTYVHEALVGHVHGEGDVPSRSQLQKAFVRLDAYPERVFRGHVQTVGSVPYFLSGRADGTVSFRTIVAIDEPVEGLRPDMSAQVTIVLDEDAPSKVLTVPVEAILPGLGNHRKLYVLKEEGPEEREVVVGFSNDEEAQILSGLQEGEEVVVNPEELNGERGVRSGGGAKHRRTRRR
jgi:multidrug resistance efflux pump